jgi:hypothetical protein
MSDQSERPRSFLTEEDREYLRGESELKEGSEYNTKRRIRERTDSALRDFTLLFDHLEDSEQDKIFEASDGSARVFEDDEFRRGCRDALAFLLRNGRVHQHINNRVSTPRTLPAQQFFEEAIRRIAAKDGYLIRDIDQMDEIINGERIPWKNLERRLREGEDLPKEAIGYLLQHEDIDEKAIQEQLREMIIDGEE